MRSAVGQPERKWVKGNAGCTENWGLTGRARGFGDGLVAFRALMNVLVIWNTATSVPEANKENPKKRHQFPGAWYSVGFQKTLAFVSSRANVK